MAVTTGDKSEPKLERIIRSCFSYINNEIGVCSRGACLHFVSLIYRLFIHQMKQKYLQNLTNKSAHYHYYYR